MEAYVCKCCGGTVDPHTMTCEYCGTHYQHDIAPWDKPLRIETYTNPVQTLGAKVFINGAHIQMLGEKAASELAVRQMMNALADQLAPYLVISAEPNPEYCGYDVIGMMKVIRPVHGADKWRFDG